MNDPFRVRVTGPLAPYAVGFREDLLARGYAPASAAVLLQLMAQLSRWLGDEGFDVGGLTADRIERFFELRRERVRVLFLSPRSLRLLFEHLDRVGVLPAADVLPVSADQLLVERYGRFLLQERALAAGSAVVYLNH